MHPRGRALRLAAVVMAAVVILTLAAPARAGADVLTTLAIVSVVVAGVVIVVYLIVANVRDSRRAAEASPVYLACIESDAEPRSCWPVASPGPAFPVGESPESP